VILWQGVEDDAEGAEGRAVERAGEGPHHEEFFTQPDGDGFQVVHTDGSNLFPAVFS